MTLPPQRWLKIVVLATALIFLVVAFYIYGFKFSSRLHPDDTVMILLAEKMLEAKSPIATDWFYANGDVWVVGPQLIALVPVAVLGLGTASLLISLVIGFVLQLVAFAKAYARLGAEMWVAVFAAVVTSIAWSNAHVDYVYVQLAYGFVTFLYVLAFSSFANVAESPARRALSLSLAGLLVVAIAVQNPTRGLVFVVAPVLVGCAWPWREFPMRMRLQIAAVALSAWAIAFVIYRWLIVPAVTFSIPRGHTEFVIGGLGRIKANLALLGRGLVILCGGGEATVLAVPGALLLLGALGFVVREALASRVVTARRFVCVIVLVQLGGVLVPLIAGNLLTDKESARYVMPSMLALLGLATLLAVRAASDGGSSWWRRIAIGWLAAVPIAAAVAAVDAAPRAPQQYLRPDSAELSLVADALVERGLTYGFSINIAANLITMYSGGAARTCPVHFRNVVMVHRWLADANCFVESRIPDRFYVVVDRSERERGVLRETFPPEIEKFSVGDTYEVFVYKKAGATFAWLELPIPDGDLAAFPIRFPATHLQLIRGNAAVAASDVVATGVEGTVIYGPYIELPKGRYTATWVGSGVESVGPLSFLVSRGSKEFARRELEAGSLPRNRGELAKMPFTLARATTGIEFLVQAGPGARVSLHELVIEKVP